MWSTSHTADGWSADSGIEMSWEGAYDPDGLGVSGYSYLFDETSDTLPDTSEDQAHTGGVQSTSSTSVSDGAHYFHLRTCDLDGNCTETVHAGPYNVDLTAPATATDVTSTTHTIGVSSTRCGAPVR